jgi:hypothetical protein
MDISANGFERFMHAASEIGTIGAGVVLGIFVLIVVIIIAAECLGFDDDES